MLMRDVFLFDAQAGPIEVEGALWASFRMR